MLSIMRFLSPSAIAMPALVAIAALALAAPPTAADPPLPPPAKRTIDFAKDIYPLLKQRCAECHFGADAASGHRLDLRDSVTGESTGLPLVEIGASADSRLIQLVAGLDPKLQMPPEGERLSAAEIGILRAWIDQGLSWDEKLLPPQPAASSHWAFQPLARPRPPQRDGSRWSRSIVDAYVAEKHRELQLEPAEEAPRRVLLRRLSLDLTGLPPDIEEVEAFERDSSPDAYERWADRLLASPRYGERWGRHWLDVARWAETEGYESNHPRHSAWRYRDWVIDSFNADKPYDQFLRQQLAGDEMEPYSDENLVATGFLAAARISSNEEDKWLQRSQVLAEVVNATGSAFLGLTIHCAQCHSHKFDPISIRDYYALEAFFVGGQPVSVAIADPQERARFEAHKPPEYEPLRQLKELIYERGRQRFVAAAREKMSEEMRLACDTPAARRTRTQEKLAREASLKFQITPEGIERSIPAEDKALYDAAKKKLQELEKSGLAEPQAFAFYSPATSPHALRVLPALGFYPLPYDPAELRGLRSYIHIRGDVHRIGATVAAGWPAVLEATFPRQAEASSPQPSTSLNRLALADWLSHPRHPLTARVWVNRLWHYHFGRGIVATPSDFGVKGAPPTHPDLLDWLACELVDSGYSTKFIQRRIVQSATYRLDCRLQSPKSRAQSPQGAIDSGVSIPADVENRFLWRFTPRRLEAEAIRDCILAVSGQLALTGGGPSVPLGDENKVPRRSVYLYQKRGVVADHQRLFDGPVEMAESCEGRHTTTTPLQPLYLLNSELGLSAARTMAQRVRAVADRPPAQVIEAFRLALGRAPGEEELAASLDLLGQPTEGQNDALVLVCQAILNANEFVYIE
jgi:hypothetical protein